MPAAGAPKNAGGIQNLARPSSKISPPFQIYARRKIDRLFSDLIESMFLASYAAGNAKTTHITTASAKLDVLKYFLQVAWELKCVDRKQYAAITPLLAEVGKMIGGWMKHAERKTPPV